MLNASDRVEEWQDDFAAEAETSGETARQPSESCCRSRRACSERGGSSPISVLFFAQGGLLPPGAPRSPSIGKRKQASTMNFFPPDNTIQSKVIFSGPRRHYDFPLPRPAGSTHKCLPPKTTSLAHYWLGWGQKTQTVGIFIFSTVNITSLFVSDYRITAGCQCSLPRFSFEMAEV